MSWRLARRGKSSFSLRDAQQRMAAVNERFRSKGPVSNLPVPDTDEAERITAAELAEDDQ